MKGEFKIGLALGSGGARGLAHIGVLKALKQEDVELDIITGASFGALIGGMYAVNPDPNEIEHRIMDFIASETFRKFRMNLIKMDYKAGKRAGIVKNVKDFLKLQYFMGIPYQTKSYATTRKLAEIIARFIKGVDIKETKIQFAAVAADIVKGEEIIIDKGDMRKAVRATCSIPGIFPPVKYDGRLLVDGGWANRVPVNPTIGQGADFVIAIDVSKDIKERTDYRNGLDILMRANIINNHILSQIQLKDADIIIEPAVGHIHWTEFTRIKEIISLGADAATNNIQSIKTAIALKKKHKLSFYRTYVIPLFHPVIRR